MFTRSLATVGMGIRVNALCPEYVETPLLNGVPSFFVDYLRDKVGLVEMEKVVAGMHRYHRTPPLFSLAEWLHRILISNFVSSQC